MSVYITEKHPRLEWREHLTGIALSEAQAEWEQGEYSKKEHKAFIRGMAMLIGNSTWLETEHTSDVEDAAYQTLMEAYDERERAEKQAERDRWLAAAASGTTDKGFHQWLADRD